jgi:hypothetical protein
MIDQNTEISGRMNLSDIPADMMAAANTVSDWMKRVGITHFMGVQLRDFLEDAPRESGSSMPPQVTTMTGILDRVAEPGSNQAIADALREHGGLDLLCAGVARLLEADAKNHDMLANEAVMWRCLCEEFVRASEAWQPDGGEQERNMIRFIVVKAYLKGIKCGIPPLPPEQAVLSSATVRYPADSPPPVYPPKTGTAPSPAPQVQPEVAP